LLVAKILVGSKGEELVVVFGAVGVEVVDGGEACLVAGVWRLEAGV
jgi:hypothetical protein